MNRLATLLVLAVASGGCGEADSDFVPSTQRSRPSGPQPILADWLPEEARPATGGTVQAPAAAPAPSGGGMVRGRVTETMDSGGYTYMHVETTDGLVWVATSQREVAVGATVEATGMTMRGFHSSTLDRTFDQLVLASAVEITDAQ